MNPGVDPAAETPSFEQVESAVRDSSPRLSRAEQQLALDVYRLLSRGEAFEPARLSEKVAPAVANVARRLTDGPLRCLVAYDDAGRIIGFAGLTVRPTRHRLLLGSKSLFTWCAWDALFIPELLEQTVQVESQCPVSGDSIRLEVMPGVGVKPVSSHRPVVSFLIGDALQRTSAEESIRRFCNQVNFLAASAARDWIDGHPGGFVLSLDDAFRLGAAYNRHRFGERR